MSLLTRLWRRYVRTRSDGYRAYVSLPTAAGKPSVGEIRDCIDDLEYVFEGRLDVYARLRGVAVVSDPVPAEQFDVDAFEAALERLEECYPETHTLARVEKRRREGGRLVTSHVVVPVEPLFSRRNTTDASQATPATE